MESNFNTLWLQKRKKEDDKVQEFKKASKERLLKICQKKVETTMIGALVSIEDELSKYWQTDGSGKLTNEQLLLKAAYEKIRKEILDKGNHQKRNMETEFEQYDIEWKRYTLKLPVVQGT